jgi:hypothetical protein
MYKRCEYVNISKPLYNKISALHDSDKQNWIVDLEYVTVQEMAYCTKRGIKSCICIFFFSEIDKMHSIKSFLLHINCDILY